MNLPNAFIVSILADSEWSEAWIWIGIAVLVGISLTIVFLWPHRVLCRSGFDVKTGVSEMDFTRVEWVTVDNQLWENVSAVKILENELLLKVDSRAEVYSLSLEKVSEIEPPEWIEPLAAKQSRFRIQAEGRDVALDLGKEMNARLSDALRARSAHGGAK